MRQVNNIILDILRRNTDSDHQGAGRNLKTQIYIYCVLFFFLFLTYEETEVERLVYSLGICGSARN